MAKLLFTETPLRGVYVIEPNAFVDHRGFFARMFCSEELKEHGLKYDLVQANHSGSRRKGTIRGMHYQLPPHAETKIVKCVKGRVYDVVIDVRKNSPTFLQWYGIELNMENKKQLYIPEGFAHGFQALEDDAEIIYLVTAFYTMEFERGVRFNDAAIGIEWPLKENIIISEKDNNIPLIDDGFKGI